jgi:hypothetical protein
MHTSLIVLGLLTAAAGFVAIGFGIPVNAFSFGNTLITAGTTAVVGGFVLIGLGAIARQLKRLGEATAPHATMLQASLPSADPFEVQAQLLGSQPGSGLGLSPKTEPMPRAQFPSEPKLAASLSPAAEPDSSIAWLRPKDGEPTVGERAIIEEFEASLTPQPSPRPVPPPTMPKMPEPKPWTPLGKGEPAAEAVTLRAEPAARTEGAPAGSFDTVWPDTRPARNAEIIARASKPEPTKPAREPIRAQKENARAAPASEESRPVAILKSGMIDGMAYTLFADGSIEAVLPTGPIRFASVDALRAHLEKNG